MACGSSVHVKLLKDNNVKRLGWKLSIWHLRQIWWCINQKVEHNKNMCMEWSESLTLEILTSNCFQPFCAWNFYL
uniref:Uncharacterized protein n=1 Tax=Rhizophora mucronata TaxID=61149 RepID=A0A2P2P7I2_RHIMU